MEYFNFYSIWNEDYLQRESEFLEIIKYIPFETDHDEVWSLKLANLLLLIGSSIDSFLQSAMNYCLNQIVKEKNSNLSRLNYNYNEISYELNLLNMLHHGGEKITNRKRVKRISMAEYMQFFENYYNLSNETVYLLRNGTEVNPFYEWSNQKSPEWWTVYVNLKHNKYKNKKSATLKTVSEALASLFLLNIYHIENRINIFNQTSIIKTRLNLVAFMDYLKPKIKIDTLEAIVAKTDLFGYIYDTTSVNYRNNPWFILDPNNESLYLH